LPFATPTNISHAEKNRTKMDELFLMHLRIARLRAGRKRQQKEEDERRCSVFFIRVIRVIRGQDF
jgi:hypothetical protein